MKAIAIIEVVVVFSITLMLLVLISLSPMGQWQRQVTHRPFIEYAVMITIPMLVLVAARRNLSDYGLSLQPFSYHLDVALTALVPVALSAAPLAFLNYRQGKSALVLGGIQIGLLFVLGGLLRRKPTRNNDNLYLGGVFLIGFQLFAGFNMGNALSAFVFYIFFLGLGEELLFRGYIQSRLNAVFGRPFRFYGVNWGWGVIIAAVLFGIMHVLNPGSLVKGDWQLAGWWGFWTFFAGLVLSFVREKTGSIVASVILHGLPQAIAYAYLGIQ
ncbi:MAG: hypothetical protein Kow0042_07290 [Calditrichia bacterium]